MILFVVNIVTFAAVAFLIWLRGSDKRVEHVRTARLLRIAALVPLGLQAAIFLAFGFGEMAGGDLSGAAHLLEVAGTALLGVLAWKRPLEAGAALFAGGVLFAAGLLASMPAGQGAVISPAMLILGVPELLSGALFFTAGLLARRATTT